MALLVCSSCVERGAAPARDGPRLRALPGRPALASATLGILEPIDAALPLVVGAIDPAFGSGAPVASLLVAPIGVGLAARSIGPTHTF